jgi:hypothetical protein
MSEEKEGKELAATAIEKPRPILRWLMLWVAGLCTVATIATLRISALEKTQQKQQGWIECVMSNQFYASRLALGQPANGVSTNTSVFIGYCAGQNASNISQWTILVGPCRFKLRSTIVTNEDRPAKWVDHIGWVTNANQTGFFWGPRQGYDETTWVRSSFVWSNLLADLVWDEKTNEVLLEKTLIRSTNQLYMWRLVGGYE